MNSNDQLIDEDSLKKYVVEYDIVPGLVEKVKKAQDENPGIEALALRPINIERTIDQLKARDITTISQLNEKLEKHKDEIIQLLNNYDPASIAAKHVYTPIYILLESM